jgi:hypothetical protein
METLLEGCTWNSLHIFHCAKAGQLLGQNFYHTIRSTIDPASGYLVLVHNKCWLLMLHIAAETIILHFPWYVFLL